MTKTNTSEPWPDDIEAEKNLPSDEVIVENLNKSLGENFFDIFKDGNEPLASEVAGNRRRSNAYKDRKERALKLASIMMNLTPMQSRFVTHYVAKDWDSLSEVTIRAGSKAEKLSSLRMIAYQILKIKDVQEAIGLMTLSKLEAEGIDRYEIIAMLRDTYNCSMADGKYKEAKECAELLGSAIGVFDVKKVGRDLSKVEHHQLKELNQVSRKASLATVEEERKEDSTFANQNSVDLDLLFEQIKTARGNA